MRSFASDNNSGVHPSVLQAIKEANRDHAVGYGADPWSEQAEAIIRTIFGSGTHSFFVFNGTGANTVALRACTQPYHSIIAAASAHIAVDECGAPTFQTGCQIKEITTPDGKLTPILIREKLVGIGEEHHSQPKVVYLSQCSEFGTVYTPEEIRAIADLIHAHRMYLHMDGARLSNAAAYLNIGLKETSVDCGVDILSFGGTKNGMMMGEAVICFRPELAENIQYIRKQSAQLYSKMRYASCQFVPYLQDNLWLRNAQHANRMAQLLAQGIQTILPVEFSQSVEANILLFKLPRKVIDTLLKNYFFYIWNEVENEVRLVTSFDTTEDDVNYFLSDLDAAVKAYF